METNRRNSDILIFIMLAANELDISSGNQLSEFFGIETDGILVENQVENISNVEISNILLENHINNLHISNIGENAFEEVINIVQEISREETINQSLTTGVNIDARKGLSSKFINFVRGAVIVKNDDDEQNLDKINKMLMELEKIDKNNISKIINIFVDIINYISCLSPEVKNDILQAFIKQSTLEEKMNESFPQIGTIMIYSATLKNNKTIFSEKDIKILSEMAQYIEILDKIDCSKEFTKNTIINCLNISYFKASPYAQEIFLKIIENNRVFFEDMWKRIEFDFDKFTDAYRLPIKNRKIM